MLPYNLWTQNANLQASYHACAYVFVPRSRVLKCIEELEAIVRQNEWENAKKLIDILSNHGKKMMSETQRDTLFLATILRVLKLIREEALKCIQGIHAEFEENLTNRLFAVGDVDYSNASGCSLRESILAAISDLVLELTSVYESISGLSLDFIHSDELILTIGYSKAVYQFLKTAAKRGRIFKVMVCESYPENSGHEMAEVLSKDNVSVILVPDSHAFGLMSRVNKVIVDCQAIYSDGTLKAATGTHAVMLAAKRCSIPVSDCHRSILFILTLPLVFRLKFFCRL
ncbi:unnamed protein product [Protopolystoma xenopodis]|uniref:Translation initiation factor eIF2B subunit beta n=1 Tax=Protopolystoma xenopodis TaxID=117903 RepID=A0A448WZ09_9PLAT|nr:unnamed protein product [Protopolystoma xenopodis]